MDGNDAWERFASSGRIEDYLEYRRQGREEMPDEHEHRRADNQGKHHGRK